MEKYNIVFGESALGTFRQAQSVFPGLDGKRIPFCDDLSLGPLFLDIEKMINTRKILSEGVFSNLHQTYGENFETEYNYLIEIIEILGQDDVIIIWTANGVIDRCGSLFIQYMLRDKECSVYEINASSVNIINKLGTKIEIKDVGHLSKDNLISLIGRETLISKSERESNVNEWITIVSENKELRIYNENKIINVENNYYDSLILRYTENHYKKSMRVIGSVLGNCGQVVKDGYLKWRTIELINQGTLKYRLASDDEYLNQGIIKYTIDLANLRLFEIKK